jgi:hypothetical protein
LFRQKQLSALSFLLSAKPSGLAQTPKCGVCDVPKGQVKASGTIPPNFASGESQTFKGNDCAIRLDFLTSSFIFIDILALFPEFCGANLRAGILNSSAC